MPNTKLTTSSLLAVALVVLTVAVAVALAGTSMGQ
jgi:hypothetical protein